MANCPNCNKKLRLTDWRPNCPKCGVNLMFYGFEEKFYEDAKLTELSLAGMRTKTKRAGASFVGNLTAKLRLCTCLLPLAALLLPMGTLRAALPFAEKQWSAGLMGLFGLMGSTDELSFLRQTINPGQAELFRYGLLMLGAAALAFAMGALVFSGSALTFISVKPTSAIAGTASVLGALACAVGFASGLLLRQSSAALHSPIFSGSLGWGALLTFAAFCFTAVLNLRLAKKGVPVHYAEGDYERAQIYKRVKKGELKLADLPYPVVETEATREEEALIQKELKGVRV